MPAGSLDPAQITITPNPIKTGITLLPLVDPLYKRVVVSVPIEQREWVTSLELTLTGPGAGRATLDILDVNAETGTITVDVYGVTATPPETAPNGDTTLEVKKGAETLKTAPVLVLIPVTNTHTVAAPTIINQAWQSFPSNQTIYETVANSIITITFKDQFGQILDEIYNRTHAVIEDWDNHASTPANWADAFAEGTINLPTGQLTNGVILDQVGSFFEFRIEGIDPTTKLDNWRAFQYPIPLPGGGTLDNAVAFNAFEDGVGTPKKLTASADQILHVHGHAVSPNYKRTITISAINHAPVNPVEVTDVAQ